MNADKELRDMRRRLDLSLQQAHLEAVARLYDMTPAEYQQKVCVEGVQSVVSNIQQLGAAYSRAWDSLVAGMEAFTQGWNSVQK